MYSDEFERVVDVLNSVPKEPCVIREQFLADLNIDPLALAIAAKRTATRATEIIQSGQPNMALKDVVFHFSPHESA